MSWQKWIVSSLVVLLLTIAVLYFYRFNSAQAIFPIKGEFIQVEGIKLYLTDRGEGHTVIFLHGFPYNSDSFTAITMQPWPGYRFLTIDFPGLGLSGKGLKKNMTPEDLALMVKLLLDKLNISETDVVGHDLGGGVAMVLAANYPQLVKKNVLLAPDSSAGNAGSAMSGIWQIPMLGEIWAALRLNRGFIRDLLAYSWNSQSTDWRQDVERYTRPLDTAYGRQGFLGIHRGRLGFDYLNYEERLQVDCLLLWGKNDEVVPITCADRLLQSLNHARLEIIPGCGHLVQEEASEQVAGRIKVFLEKAE